MIDKNLETKIKSLGPGNPCNLVNWDMFNNIPDLWVADIATVPFKKPEDIKNKKFGDFYPTRDPDSFMPVPSLMDKIAEAKRIIGLDSASPTQIVAIIDYNIMRCNFSDVPCITKYPVGWSCTKMGSLQLPDGTLRPSMTVTASHNAWERCCLEWSKEESATDFYKNVSTKNGVKYYSITYPSGKTYQNECKYDTFSKRKKKFDDEMLYAQRKSDTKAREGVIRTLCGMPTGYKLEDLQVGAFYISYIRRSDVAQKAEWAARLQAMSHGIGDNTASKALFGPADTPEAEPQQQPEQETEPDYTVSDDMPESDTADIADQALETQQQSAPKPITGEWMKAAFESYVKGDLVTPANKDTVANLIKWLSTQKNPEKWEAAWNKALKTVETVEAAIPEEMRVTR